MIKRTQVWCQTDIGLKRANNEDAFLIDPDLGLYIIADGMGGHQAGEVASNMAVQIIREVITESYEKDAGVRPQELLQKAYSQASQRIYEKSLSSSDYKGMGTTLVVSIVRDGKIYFANVGDSRVYLIREEGCWQITEDHSLVNEQIKAGLITEDQIASAKNVITRSVGFERNIVCDVLERKLNVGDSYILCTDGLSGMVTDTDIYDMVQKCSSEEVVGSLINQAKDNGGLDNVTVMFMKVFEGE